MKTQVIKISFLVLVGLAKCYAQQPPLKSFDYAWNLIYRNAHKDTILTTIQYKGRLIDDSDMVRIDNIGRVSQIFPLIVAVVEPMQSDSLGLIPMELKPETIRKMTQLLDRYNTGIEENFDRREYGFRLTYRIKKKTKLYYIFDKDKLTLLVRDLESLFKKEKIAFTSMQRYYMFLYNTELGTVVDGNWQWNKYW